MSNGWAKPEPLPESINSIYDEFYPAIVNSGNIYFARELEATSYDIYVSELINGQYQMAKALGENINTKLLESDAYIVPDESYMVFVRMYADDGYGVSDLYIGFKVNGEWSRAINLGSEINSPGVDGSHFVSSDGKYLYFTSTRDSAQPEEFDGKLDLYVVKFEPKKHMNN